jgi:small subunit ribosomal protein S9
VSDAEHPEDEPRPDGEAAADEVPAESAEEPAAQAPEPPESAEEPAAEEPEPEPAAEPVADAEPAAEEPAPAAEEPAPAAEEAAPAAEEPAPAAEPVADAESPAEEPAPAAEAPAAAEQPTPTAAQPQAETGAEEDDEEELAPRQRPEIPGADLIPDIVSDSDEFMDAEARAAAEAAAEEAAAREEEQDSDRESQPIADAAIDLAAGARYTATGKRKTAVARVILKPGSGSYAINGKELNAYYPRETLQRIIRQPLEAVGYDSRMDVVARMHGGGVAAQAGALRHGIARALLEADPNLRGELKRRGFLTRDPRVKERKKAGLKKARKRPQFSKR